MSSLAYATVPINEVRSHPKNPRHGDIPAIARSLAAHEQYRPIVVQRSTGLILAGNHTWQAAKQLGWTELDVAYVDVDDDQALRILLVDNRLSDVATYDDDALAAILNELATGPGALEGTGWEPTDLADLNAVLQGLGDPVAIAGDNRDVTVEDFARMLRIRMGQAVYDRWKAWVQAHDGDEAASFVGLLDKAGA